MSGSDDTPARMPAPAADGLDGAAAQRRRRFLDWLGEALPAGLREELPRARPQQLQTLVRLAAEAVACAEENLGRLPSLSGQTTSMHCRAGCSHCCSLPVLVSIPELLRLARYAERHLSVEQLEALRRRARDARSAFERIAPRQVRGLRHPCPFLCGERCSVYPARPLACRGWHSYDLDACLDLARDPAKDLDLASDLAGDPARDPASGAAPGTVPQNLRYRMVFDGIGEALAKALAARAVAPLTYLAAGAAACLDPQRDDAIEMWLDGASPFAPGRPASAGGAR